MLLFFDFGSGEIILIILVLFIVLGPKRLPEVARTMGKTINEMKRASAGFKNEINKEVQKLERETRLNDFLKERESKPAALKEEETPAADGPEGSISMQQSVTIGTQAASQPGNDHEISVKPNKIS